MIMKARDIAVLSVGASLLGIGALSDSEVLDQHISSIKEVLAEYINPDNYYKEKASGWDTSSRISGPVVSSLDGNRGSYREGSKWSEKFWADWQRAIEDDPESFRKERRTMDDGRKKAGVVVPPRQQTFEPHEYASEEEYDDGEYEYVYEKATVPEAYQWYQWHHYGKSVSYQIDEQTITYIPPTLPDQPVTSVPNPGTFYLLVSGVMGLVIYRRNIPQRV